MEQYLSNFKSCRQREIPFCTSECPFHLDVFDFIEKMKRGGFKAAFKTYRNAVGFPVIASRLCPEPCKGVCPGKDSGGAIELGLLERACILFTDDRDPTDYNLPMKKKKIAVIGAGISGFACALRLCMKKYEVEIFEKTPRIGGSLWSLLEPELFLSDIEKQFRHEKYTLHLDTEIQTVDDLSDRDFDAVYVATGKSGADFGLLNATRETGDKYCARYEAAGWFAGGELIGETPIKALAGGLYAGTAINNFLKTGKLLYPDSIQPTRTCVDPLKSKLKPSVIPINGKASSPEEAQAEASRCLECRCDFCRTYCDLTEYFNKWPLRIRDEVMATILPGSADVKATPAKRLLSTCNQCGLCKEVCPEDIDLGGLILAGRKSMHRQKKAPWVFHDFWLREMEFANGELAAISKVSEITESESSSKDLAGSTAEGSYAFFPGCQLGASDPTLVERTYEYLLNKRADTGFMLRCCGAPAEWSGDEEKFRVEIETIYKLWEGLGKPTLILACPTCEKKFKTHMAGIPVISLYEVIDDWGVETVPAGKVYSVFDACAARHEIGMKRAVRRLAEATGCRLEPSERHDAFEQCCGYGGQPGIANPKYTEFVTQERIAESKNPYITYCINCRDIFTDAGKEAVHILDLLFSSGKPSQKIVTVSERRKNRILLKKRMLQKFWGEKMEIAEKKTEIKLNIPSALSQKLNREKIFEEDLADVVAFCERTGRRVWLPDKQIYSGYREEGFMTYWVEYKEGSERGTYELVNTYTHRMRIKLETVWNGRKTDADL